MILYADTVHIPGSVPMLIPRLSEKSILTECRWLVTYDSLQLKKLIVEAYCVLTHGTHRGTSDRKGKVYLAAQEISTTSARDAKIVL